MKSLILIKIIFSILLFNIFSVAHAKANLSLCKQNEKIAFSCQMKNKKNVSLCVNAANENFMYYRYGTKSKIELSYPNKDTPYDKAFTFAITHGGAQVRNDEVSFKVDDYEYILNIIYRLKVYSAANIASIINGKEIFNQTCFDTRNYFVVRSPLYYLIDKVPDEKKLRERKVDFFADN